jgi:hypothetical protein
MGSASMIGRTAIRNLLASVAGTRGCCEETRAGEQAERMIREWINMETSLDFISEWFLFA